MITVMICIRVIHPVTREVPPVPQQVRNAVHLPALETVQAVPEAVQQPVVRATHHRVAAHQRITNDMKIPTMKGMRMSMKMMTTIWTAITATVITQTVWMMRWMIWRRKGRNGKQYDLFD